MSLRSHSYVKAFLVLPRADHLYILNYITYTYYRKTFIGLRPILLVWTRLECTPYCLCV